jgi:hypothetical protein
LGERGKIFIVVFQRLDFLLLFQPIPTYCVLT